MDGASNVTKCPHYKSYKVTIIMLKNGFAIFSGAVALGSKWGLMVPIGVWAVTVAVWAVAASMWAVTVSI